MATERPTQAARVKVWADRMTTATKLYDRWSEKFETDRLENYYLGKQWKGVQESEAQKLYTINLVYSTMEVNKPSMIFYNPQIHVQPRPGHEDDLGSTARMRAKLSEDTVQSFIDDPDVDFMMETGLALHEAHFRFGVVEVGYSADWIDNPNAGKPILKEDKETVLTDSEGAEVMQPDRNITHENLYVKRIPAYRFRVSHSSRNSLAKNDWIAYYEWQYAEDVRRNPAYAKAATAGLKSSGTLVNELKDLEDSGDDPDDNERRHGMIKIWKIWDLRSSKKYVIAQDHNKFLLEGEPFSFQPFAVIKFHEILDSFYPLPPVFNWLGPQDEINETREAQRAHRRRFYRRYTIMNGAIDDPELEKLENGGDGVIARTNTQDPVHPVQDAPMGADVWQHLDASKQDFMSVSGVSGDQRGVAESETATQANIIDSRSKIRETSARTKVANWLADISRLILLTVREKMALPIWIKTNVDPLAKDAAEAIKVAKLWQEIVSEDLGEIDLDFKVELASMSPITEEAERNSWNQVLALLTNSQLGMILAQSELLLRKTLYLYGIRNENDIQEIQKVLQNMLAMQVASAAAAAGAPGPGAAPGGPTGDVAPGQPVVDTPAELGGGTVQ